VTCARYTRGVTCGAPADVLVMETHGRRIRRTWEACGEHAPRPTASIELIDLRVPTRGEGTGE
jgi:hypothetical protein